MPRKEPMAAKSEKYTVFLRSADRPGTLKVRLPRPARAGTNATGARPVARERLRADEVTEKVRPLVKAEMAAADEAQHRLLA